MPGTNRGANDARLTPRQLDVVRLVCQDRSTKEMADELGISDSTVNVYLSQVFAELGLSSRSEVFRYVLRLVERGLVEKAIENAIPPEQAEHFRFLNAAHHPINCQCNWVMCSALRMMAKEPKEP